MKQMTAKEKKELIKKRLSTPGEKRSYNEIAADLELQLWTEQHGGKKK